MVEERIESLCAQSVAERNPEKRRAIIAAFKKALDEHINNIQQIAAARRKRFKEVPKSDTRTTDMLPVSF